MNNKIVGNAGEDLACRYLEKTATKFLNEINTTPDFVKLILLHNIKKLLFL